MAKIVRMVSIGPLLANARIAQGKTIADAAADTKIRRDYLEALEAERFEVIGGDAWVRGFIRSYGRWLGLDTTMLIKAYEGQHGQAVSPTAIPGAQHGALPLRERIRRMMPFVIGFGLVLVVVGIYWNRGTPTPEAPSEAIAPAPVPQVDGQGSQGNPATTGQGVAGSQGTTGMTGGQSQDGQPAGVPMQAPTLRVEALAPVTLIVEAGEPAINLAMKPKEIKEITDPSKVRLWVSNGAAVHVTVNGEALPPIGAEQVGVELTCELGKVACEARDR